MILSIIIFLLILSILVLIHEAGHFFIAKKFGIKVEEFGFGFPPKAFSFKKGETEYSINWLPIGGFVKLYGEDEAGAGRVQLKVAHLTPAAKRKSEKSAADKDRAFFARSPLQKATVVVAGVVMNAILAMCIFYVLFFISGFKTEVPLLGDYKFLVATQTNRNISEKDAVVSLVVKGGPAEKAGMKTPVELVSINGTPIKDRLNLIDIVNKNKDKAISLSWKEVRTGNTITANMIPRLHPPKGEGPLGIGFMPIAFLSYDSFSQRLLSGIVQPVNLMFYSFDIMKKLVVVSVKTKNVGPVSQGVSGPVGILLVTNDILQNTDLKERILSLLNLAGLLSISLAFFNILPIPALDGGRLFFILIELVTRRKVNPAIEAMAHNIGMVILLALIFIITFKDIFQAFSGKLLGQ